MIQDGFGVECEEIRYLDAGFVLIPVCRESYESPERRNKEFKCFTKFENYEDKDYPAWESLPIIS